MCGGGTAIHTRRCCWTLSRVCNTSCLLTLTGVSRQLENSCKLPCPFFLRADINKLVVCRCEFMLQSGKYVSLSWKSQKLPVPASSSVTRDGRRRRTACWRLALNVMLVNHVMAEHNSAGDEKYRKILIVYRLNERCAVRCLACCEHIRECHVTRVTWHNHAIQITICPSVTRRNRSVVKSCVVWNDYN